MSDGAFLAMGMPFTSNIVGVLLLLALANFLEELQLLSNDDGGMTSVSQCTTITVSESLCRFCAVSSISEQLFL